MTVAELVWPSSDVTMAELVWPSSDVTVAEHGGGGGVGARQVEAPAKRTFRKSIRRKTT